MTELLKKAFRDMKESAKAQYEVDKAEFAVIKAECKANFEENRGCNTFAKAKAEARKSWDDAHLSSSQRREKTQKEYEGKLASAKKRTIAANE